MPQVDACSPPATANEHINVLFTGVIKARCAGRPLEPRALPCTRLCRPRTLWHLCMSSVPITMTARWHAHAVNTRVCCLQLRASIVVSGHDGCKAEHIHIKLLLADATGRSLGRSLGHSLGRSRSDTRSGARSDARMFARMFAQSDARPIGSSPNRTDGRSRASQTLGHSLGSSGVR